MATFSVYSGNNLSGLVNSFLGANSGIVVDTNSIKLNASAADAVNIYDGSLGSLGIGSGLLLTSGTTPGTSNTIGWFGTDNTQYYADGTSNFFNGDADIDAVVNTVFQTQSYDATTLSFNFTVTDPAATSVSFDLVFGSDEYPEWVDQFVDCAVIIVNGVNYAFFNHDPNAPLSVISPNLAAGYFQDNAGNILPIEYDGVSHVLKIVAPIKAGQTNTIKIGVADTGDHILDSGMFIANMTAGTTPGSGVVITPDVPCTNGADTVTGTVADELINLLGGDDTAYAGGGDDIVVAGAGNDKVYGGTGNDTLEGDEGNDLLDGGEGTANAAVYKGSSADFAVSFNAASGKYTLDDNGTDALDEGVDTLGNIQMVKFSDGLFDLTANGLVAHVDNTGGGANIAGSVTLSGLALPGHALSAIVVDANGVPTGAGAVTFQWLTSTDGITWTNTGITSQSYTLTDADAGLQVKATASYTDKAGHAELASSAGTLVAKATGDVTIQPMVITTPAGGSVANPLTTLIQNAADLGYTPAMAENAVKAALGLPDIDLRTYDAYAILTANPTDATALSVMKIAAEVAMTASVSDPSGYNLAIAMLQAADQGTVLDLTDPATLDTLLAGVDPNLLDIVMGLNKDMGDTSSFAAVNKVWNDWAGQADNLKPYIGHLDTISIHINQAPEGFCNASLAAGEQDQAYTILASDLLAGFSDPEGASLTISSISADIGGTVADNGDGTFTFTPNAGYNGPVELSFAVSDPDGASIAGNTMLIIEASAPTGGGDTTAPTATITSDMTGTVNGDISFTVTFSEAVNALDATSFTVSHGTISSVTESGGVYTVVVTPQAGFEGAVQLTLPAGAASDLAGNPTNSPVAASQAVDTLSPSVSIADNAPGTAAGSVTYTLTFSEAVTGLAADDLVVTHGTVASVSGSGKSWTVVVTPEAGFEGTMGLSVNAGAVTDAVGNASAAAVAAGQAIDTKAPTVATFAPADGATGAGSASNIVVTFSEGVKLGTGTIAIHAGSATGTVLESFDVATSARVTISGSTLTIDPASTLSDGTQYFVTFSAGVVTDMAGNAYAGTATYDFTTAAAQALNLTGTAGADVLTGGSANDTLSGLGGTDKMDGRDGSDVYIIGAASEHSAAEIADTGTTGVDEVRFTASGTATLNLFAGDTGIELVTAAPGTATLSINAAAVLNGLTLQGNAGANTLTGTGFDDVLIGGAGNDILTGGNGIDTASYADQTSAVTVNLSLTKAQNTVGAGSDTLKGIENLIGGSGNDLLTGASGANRIEGGAGNDTIDGGAGSDTLIGGDGADTILAGAGNDALWGGLGADTFVFKATADSVIAGPDTIWDFSQAEGDKIDLRSIDANSGVKGDQAFTLAASFTHKSGELVVSTEGDHYLVQGDVNGDAVADFAIAVHSVASLGAGDFLL